MKVTPDIIREEFIGTTGAVTSSSHAGYLGIRGEVLNELETPSPYSKMGKPNV